MLIAIANIVGINSENLSFDELIKRVEANVARAASLESRVRILTAEIQILDDKAYQNQAESLLAKADLAFSAGQFSRAEALFLEISRLGQREDSKIQKALISALDSAADAAFLQGAEDDLERAKIIKLESSKILQSLGGQLMLESWRLALDAMVISREKYTRFGNSDDIKFVLDIFFSDIKPLIRRIQSEKLSYESLLEISRSSLILDEVSGGSRELQDQAFHTLGYLVVNAPKYVDDVEAQDIVDAHFLLSDVTLRLAQYMQGEDKVNAVSEAVRFVEVASKYIKFKDNRFNYAHLALVYGKVLIAQANEQTKRGEEIGGVVNYLGATAAIEAGIEKLNRETEPLEWARLRNYQCLATIELGVLFKSTEEGALSTFLRAIDYCSDAFAAINREDSVFDWLQYQGNLGLAQLEASEVSTGQSQIDYLQDAQINLQNSISSLAKLGFKYIIRLENTLERAAALQNEIEHQK